jgi:SPP1 family predicted phage head-tail adaptor
MRAGTARHRLTIETPVETAESTLGQPVPAWNFFADCWAAVEPVTGNERFVSAQLLGEVTHTIRMRYLPNVTIKMRAKLGTRILRFVSVLNMRERNRELVITAVEEVPARA